MNRPINQSFLPPEYQLRPEQWALLDGEQEKFLCLVEMVWALYMSPTLAFIYGFALTVCGVKENDPAQYRKIKKVDMISLVNGLLLRDETVRFENCVALICDHTYLPTTAFMHV